MKRRQIKKMKNVYNQAHAQFKSSHFNEAIKLLTRSAQGGYLPSMLTLGRFYYWGKGVPTDVDKAIFWLQRAADTGSRAAHYILGKIYFTMIAPDKVLSGVHLCDEDFYKSQRKQFPPQQLRILAYDHFCMAHDPIWMGIMNYEAGNEERAKDNFSFAFEKKADPLSALYLWRITSDSTWYEIGRHLLGESATKWNDWAYTLCEWGEYAKALPYIEKALSMEKENEISPEFLDTYAECLYGLDRKQEAKQFFQECLESYNNRNNSLMSRVTLIKMKQKF